MSAETESQFVYRKKLAGLSDAQLREELLQAVWLYDFTQSEVYRRRADAVDDERARRMLQSNPYQLIPLRVAA